jgi:hypothetical protein
VPGLVLLVAHLSEDTQPELNSSAPAAPCTAYLQPAEQYNLGPLSFKGFKVRVGVLLRGVWHSRASRRRCRLHLSDCWVRPT